MAGLAALLVAFFFTFLSLPASAINVDWIPADADGPLPASREFREKLLELCITLRKNVDFADALPDHKRKTVRSMCRRLREAELAERGAYDYAVNQEPASRLWMGFLFAGIALIWYYRLKPGSPIESYWSKKRKAARKERLRLTRQHYAGQAGQGPALSEEEMERARQARLERFQPTIPPPDAPADKDATAKKAD